MLNNEQILKFQKLFKNRFGEDITREQALDYGLSLIELIRLTYKPIKKHELPNYKNN